jgi:RNA polymerase sigma factor (sigma-70 family)
LVTEEAQWLRDYAAKRSDDAFRRLVDRYINLVYSSARRQVGEEELARDVTQAVFLILAEKAGQLDTSKPLSAWLMQVTRYASANAVRSRARRVRHETKAAEMNHEARDQDQWESMSPLLDEGMSKLRSGDRDVLLLRFFEKKTAREVAEALGISEDAAEKRLSRAVERLRDFFRRRGVAVSSVVVVSGLAAHSAEAAPIGLSAGISTAASGGAAASAAGVAKGTVVAMAAAKTKAAVASVVLGLVVLGGGSAAVVALVESNSPQTVKVPLRTTVSAPTAAIAAIPEGANDSVTFSDGTRIDLVAITNTPGKSIGWWRADGSPAPTVAVPPRVIGRFTVPKRTSYQFILRQYPNPAGSRDTSIGVGLEVPTAGTAYSYADPIKGGDINLMSAIETTLSSASIQLSRASGAYTEDWRYVLPTPGAAPSTRPAGVKIGKISEERPGRTQIEITPHTASPGNWQTEMRVIDAAGNDKGAVGTTDTGGEANIYEFDVPRKNVVAIYSRSRPIEFRRITTVTLHPPTTSKSPGG